MGWMDQLVILEQIGLKDWLKRGNQATCSSAVVRCNVAHRPCSSLGLGEDESKKIITNWDKTSLTDRISVSQTGSVEQQKTFFFLLMQPRPLLGDNVCTIDPGKSKDMYFPQPQPPPHTHTHTLTDFKQHQLFSCPPYLLSAAPLMSSNLKIIMTSIMNEDKHDTEIISASEEPAVKMMADLLFIFPFLACFLHSVGGRGRKGRSLCSGPGSGKAWVPM